MKIWVSFISGVLFGLGLIVSQMVNPKRVQGFLDILGAWDPTLVFVLVGAVGVTYVGYRLVFSWKAPLLAESFSLPTNQNIDLRLVIGSLSFGAGWGLSGFCPGPALVSLSTLQPDVFIFVTSMIVGMKLFQGLVA